MFCFIHFFRMPLAVSAMYVRKHFDAVAKESALEMVTNIREEFEKILEKVPWMDEVTRDLALKKAKAIKNHIGYPDELADDAKIDEYYKDLDIITDSYMLDTLRVAKFFTDYHYAKLFEPFNKTDWREHSNVATVNAFYAFLENSISK